MVVDVLVVDVDVSVEVVGLGVVIGILTGVVDVNSFVTKIGRLCMSLKRSCEAEMLKMLETLSLRSPAVSSIFLFSADVEVEDEDDEDDEAEAEDCSCVVVLVEVGSVNFGLLHKLSAPPCKNHGGNGRFVVVAKIRGAHAK